MSEIRVTSVVGENGGDRVGLTTGLTVGPLTGTTGIGATITHQGHAQFAGVCTATSFSGSGASLTGLTAGITELDMWYLTNNITSSGNDATITGWSRKVSGPQANPHGTGMSQSSGIFTFPSTGKYLVILIANFACAVDDNLQVQHRVTSDNFNTYSRVAASTDGQNGGSGTRAGSGTSICFLDITDTSNRKILFHADSVGSGSHISGGAEYDNGSTVTFIRIGDT